MNSKQHAATNGQHCPHCHATELTGESVEINNGTAEQEMSCDVCGATWTDVYALTGFKDLDAPSDTPAASASTPA